MIKKIQILQKKKKKNVRAEINLYYRMLCKPLLTKLTYQLNNFTKIEGFCEH